MTLPNDNISIMDVRNCLGYPSTDLGTLCSCNKINGWSKNKPVRLSESALNYVMSGNKLKDFSNWQRGDDGLYGFNFPTAMIHTDIVAGANWGYKPPTGGTREPYILGSFAGYRSDALPFANTIYKKGANEFEINKNAISQYEFNLKINPSSDTQIGYSDFANTNLGNCHFAVLVYDTFVTDNYPTMISADNSISEGGSAVYMNLNDFAAGKTYHCYLCLRSPEGSQQSLYPIPWDDEHYNYLILKLKDTNPFTFTWGTISNSLFGTYVNIKDYQLKPEGSQYYYTRGGIYFKVTLQSNTQQNIVVDRTNMIIKADSYFDTTETVTPSAIYDENRNALPETFTIYPSEIKTLYIGDDNVFNLRNGTVYYLPSGTQRNVGIDITFNGTKVISTNLLIQS